MNTRAPVLAFDADEAIGAIVITGNEKAFAAGADIAAMARWSYMDVYRSGYITRNWETLTRIRKPVIAAVSGLMCLVLGVTMGKSSVTNEFLDAQITETGMVRDRVVPLLDKMEELANVIERMDPRKVDWQAVQQMPADLPAIDAASILSTRVPLSPDVSGMLGKAVADLDGLFRISVDHRAFTLMRDKEELESLEKGDTFNNNQYFAAVFTPVDPKTPLLKWVPPNAQIVAVTSKPRLDASGENFVVPIRLRSGQEQEIPVQRILLVDKGELFHAGKANVLTAYSKRVEQMRARIGSVRMYASNLKNKLNAEASRIR